MAQTWVCLIKDFGTSWSNGEWGTERHYGANLTGFGLTASLNADGLLSFANTGWSRNTWNDGPYGDSNDPIANLTGFGHDCICW